LAVAAQPAVARLVDLSSLALARVGAALRCQPRGVPAAAYTTMRQARLGALQVFRRGETAP